MSVSKIEVSRPVQNLVSRIDVLETKRTELFSKLKARLAIQTLWPEAFKTGSVTARIQGSASKGFHLILNSQSEEKSFELSEIPLALACRKHIKKALKAIALGSKCTDSKVADSLLNHLWKVGK